MSSAAEEGGSNEQDMYTNMWDEVDWGFDGLDEVDWYAGRISDAHESEAEGFWGDALQYENQSTANEPSSSTTFHTATSFPPRPSPDSRVSESQSLTEQLRGYPMGATSSAPSFPTVPTTNPSASSRSQPLPLPSRRRIPSPAHREDWLDHTATRPSNSFGYLTENLFTPTGASPPYSYSDGFSDAVDIDDILNQDTESERDRMPPRTRRQAGDRSIVDLTNDSSPASESSPRPRQPKSLKRAFEGTGRERDRKRRKDTSKPVKTEANDIEELDLTNEASSAEEELAQAQTAAAVFAQQAANQTSGPLKIGQRQCIICMENFTNITITACGHVYCHECLTQALLAGEKNSEGGKANCPVCRKPVNRNKKNQVIPLSLMKKSTFKGKARRQMSVLG